MKKMGDKTTDAEICTTFILTHCFEGDIGCQYFSYKGSKTKEAYITTALAVKIWGMNCILLLHVSFPIFLHSKP